MDNSKLINLLVILICGSLWNFVQTQNEATQKIELNGTIRLFYDPKPDGIFELQSNLFYLFWNRPLSFNQIVTRYQNYYTPAAQPFNHSFLYPCPLQKSYVNKYKIEISKGCMVSGKTYHIIKFYCCCNHTHPLATNEVLTLNGHTLIPETLPENLTRGCDDGYYTEAQLDYYVGPFENRSYLVNAWGFGMKCSKDNEWHSVLIKAPTREFQFETYQKVSAVSKCKPGWAICGFNSQALMTVPGKKYHFSAFEGVFFRPLCCEVLIDICQEKECIMPKEVYKITNFTRPKREDDKPGVFEKEVSGPDEE